MSNVIGVGTHEVGVAPVGVLALQGGFAAHRAALEALGARVIEVRVPGDLSNLAGLVMPGGESTTMSLGIERERLAGPLTEFVRAGSPVLATCAGAILLDRAHLDLVAFDCDRNAYGTQTHSFEADLKILGVTDSEAGDRPNNSSSAVPSDRAGTDAEFTGGSVDRASGSAEVGFCGIFIRAPRITNIGADVEVLASLENDPVAVRHGNVTALTFHPELAGDNRIHRRFLESVPIGSTTTYRSGRKIA